MTGGESAGRLVGDLLEGKATPARARTAHVALLEKSTGTLFNIIRQYYTHSFRELFLEGQGPMQVHKAVIGVLAGNVFPRPPFALRWRLALFGLCVRMNEILPLVPRRHRFSLLASEPSPVGTARQAVGV